MKNWYYIEDCTSRRSAVFTQQLRAETATEAFIEAVDTWKGLTRNDRNDRDDAYIGYADMDENGCVDYDTMTNIYYIRRDRRPVYYLLDNLDGYGSENPFCSDAVETGRLLDDWMYQGTEDPLPDCWHEASAAELRKYGRYDG